MFPAPLSQQLHALPAGASMQPQLTQQLPGERTAASGQLPPAQLCSCCRPAERGPAEPVLSPLHPAQKEESESTGNLHNKLPCVSALTDIPNLVIKGSCKHSNVIF